MCFQLVNSFSHEFRRSFQCAVDPVLGGSVLHPGFCLKVRNLARNSSACKVYLLLDYLHRLLHGPARFPRLEAIQFNSIYTRCHDDYSRRTKHGNPLHSLSPPSFHLIYPECNSGFHWLQFPTPTLLVVGCQQADGAGRCETIFRVQVDNHMLVCIFRSHCIDMSAN